MTETSAPKEETGSEAISGGTDHASRNANTAVSAPPSDTDFESRSSGAGSDSALKVLVIDDSQTIRRSATSLLEEEGFEVITAEDGFEALSKVVANQPDIVLADVCMPRLDGYQTCALIKNNPAYSHIPIVMLSSKDSIFDKARGRIVGSEYYITKPFTRKDLVQAINRYTRQSVAAS